MNPVVVCVESFPPCKIYRRETQVGEGTYSQVFLGRETSDNTQVALKMIRIVCTTEEGEEAGDIDCTTLREISILRQLQHPNVVKLLDIVQDYHQYLDLVFEYCSSSLGSILSQFRRTRPLPAFKPAAIRSVLYQILLAVEYCHSQQVLHRDLKPDNILLMADEATIKLADFGLSRIRYTGESGSQTPQRCTQYYRAPEVLLGSLKYEPSADMWSVGCVAAELLVIARPLFFTEINTELAQLDVIYSFMGKPNELNWPGISEEFPQLDFSNNNNITVQSTPTALKEVLIKYARDEEENRQLCDLIAHLLVLCPYKRFTAKQALQHVYFQ